MRVSERPNLRAMLAILFCAMACAAEMGAQEIGCPASVVTKQSLVTMPAGWTVGEAEMPARLASVTFYSGRPEERASLAPDSGVKGSGVGSSVLTSTWRFGRASKETFWMSCGYASTTVTLSRALPEGVSGCTVVYDRGVTVAGLPEIRKISCR